MRILLYTITIFFTLSSCNNQDHYASKAKTLDSLSGALNSMLSSMKKIDTALLDRALTRYSHYQQFISQNGTDTLTKSEAGHLRTFVNCGSSLNAVKINRELLLDRAVQVNGQLSKLREDVESRAISRDNLNSVCQQELSQANKLITQGYDQQRIFFSAIEEFRNSIPSVEQIIRRKNNGELPVVINDSQEF